MMICEDADICSLPEEYCTHKNSHNRNNDCEEVIFYRGSNKKCTCVNDFPYPMKKAVSNERKNSSRIVRGDEESVSDKA